MSLESPQSRPKSNRNGRKPKDLNVAEYKIYASENVNKKPSDVSRETARAELYQRSSPPSASTLLAKSDEPKTYAESRKSLIGPHRANPPLRETASNDVSRQSPRYSFAPGKNNFCRVSDSSSTQSKRNAGSFGLSAPESLISSTSSKYLGPSKLQVATQNTSATDLSKDQSDYSTIKTNSYVSMPGNRNNNASAPHHHSNASDYTKSVSWSSPSNTTIPSAMIQNYTRLNSNNPSKSQPSPSENASNVYAKTPSNHNNYSNNSTAVEWYQKSSNAGRNELISEYSSHASLTSSNNNTISGIMTKYQSTTRSAVNSAPPRALNTLCWICCQCNHGPQNILFSKCLFCNQYQCSKCKVDPIP